MSSNGIRGVELRGEEPRRLALSDGSRLLLDGHAPDRERVEWKRVGRCQARAGASRLSVPEALELAGDEYAEYVAVRTRAEAEWMRAVADWYRDQAAALEEELAGAGSA